MYLQQNRRNIVQNKGMWVVLIKYIDKQTNLNKQIKIHEPYQNVERNRSMK